MIKSWLRDELNMYEDVAGLFAELATVDDIASFGSPLTPVLVSLTHRNMFDEIYEYCQHKGLNFSLWVDDLTISGDIVEGEIVETIRAIVTRNWLKSHKIKYRFGNKPVFITGIGVVGSHLIVPQTLNLRIKDLWKQYHEAESDMERESVTERLLSQMGTVRFIVGYNSDTGRKMSDQMNSLKQKRDKRRRATIVEKTLIVAGVANSQIDNDVVPWD